MPDYRDRVLAVAPPASKKAKLPRTKDLRPKEKSLIYDQGPLGSCTANAIATVFNLCWPDKGFQPSRLFIYYNQRAMEHSMDLDCGATVRDGLKACCKVGVCSESSWPYDTDRYMDRPPSECYREARGRSVVEYARVPQTLEDLKRCLCSGFPIVFGFVVCRSFLSSGVTNAGDMTMPVPNDKMLGGHVAVAVGYDDSNDAFVVQNSWGKAWGDGGYFHMPYDYITHPALASDFWALSLAADAEFRTNAV